MDLSGEQLIPAPRQKVWEALNDPAVLRACIPGCQSLEQDGPDRFAAVAEVRIGPIGARFKGAVELSEIDAPNGYRISGQGNGGVAGTARGQARVRLADEGSGTRLTYTVEAEVGGRMAQLGGPIIDATAKQLAGKFFAKFGEVVSGVTPAAAAAAVRAVGGPQPVSAARGMPGMWLAVVVMAIVAGFLLGRSGLAESWVIGVIALVVVAGLAGYLSGRRQ